MYINIFEVKTCLGASLSFQIFSFFQLAELKGCPITINDTKAHLQLLNKIIRESLVEQSRKKN